MVHDHAAPVAQYLGAIDTFGHVSTPVLSGILTLIPDRLSGVRSQGLWHRDDVQIWPFETLGEGRPHGLAEIYPSLIDPDPRPKVKDVGQVKALATRLQKLDGSGQLKCRMREPSSMPEAVRNEEGLSLEIRDTT